MEKGLWCVCVQVMLVDGYQGQKVQDVKKPIQKMMVDKVSCPAFRHSVHQTSHWNYCLAMTPDP